MLSALPLLSLLVLVALLTLAGCGSAAPQANAATDPSTGPPGGAVIPVVTSTDVWADIVQQIGGDRVSVTAFINDPAADPHSYEANARNQLALSKASLVVENGGGYDDFVDRMLKSAGSSVPVINAVDVSGHQPAAGADLNEHVWYDFPTVAKVAAKVAGALEAADPVHAADFRANLSTFTAALTGLEAKEAAIKTAHGGAAVAITEPVPLYMLQACGLTNKTPAAFSDAVEQGTDVSVLVLKQTLDVFSGHQVVALVYNEQTSDPQTDQLLAAAKSDSIAAVPVTETLPSGEDYVQWMTENLDALAAALG